MSLGQVHTGHLLLTYTIRQEISKPVLSSLFLFG